MTPEQTARGFRIYRFTDTYAVGCSLQQSSSMEPRVWFGPSEPNAKIFPGDNTGWHDYPLPEGVTCTTRMHLSPEQVRELLPLLTRFAETGELP